MWPEILLYGVYGLRSAELELVLTADLKQYPDGFTDAGFLRLEIHLGKGYGLRSAELK
jgi:hypothetical protein